MAVHSSAARACAVAKNKAPASTATDPIRFLAGRMGFGSPEPGSAAAAAAKQPVTVDAWFADQVAKGQQCSGYAGVDGIVEAFPTIAMTPPQVRQWLIANAGNEWLLTACGHIEQATLLLQAWSPAQLYEAMVDFFSNVLNVANWMPNTWCARGDYDRTVIRPHALGKYRDMLLASSKHPAMLIYLDNCYSFKDSLNENYGREVLELHTVGSGAGYTQADVVNSARVLTGRLVDFSKTTYIYNLNQRWAGPITIMGFSDPNMDIRAGEAAGDRYLTYLASHPSTAANLGLKMCQRFVSDKPSAELVRAVASAYLANDTAILPMLQTIVRSDEFWSSLAAKIRRPYESLAATLRATGSTPGPDLRATGATLSAIATAMGQRPLGWIAPNGYPDTSPAWTTSGTVSAQWRFQYDLVHGAYRTAITTPDVSSYGAGSAGATVGQVLDAMGTALLGAPLAPPGRAAVLAYLGEDAGSPFTSSQLAAQQAEVVALLLHSPAHSVR